MDQTSRKPAAKLKLLQILKHYTKCLVHSLTSWNLTTLKGVYKNILLYEEIIPYKSKNLYLEY
jgi:hypothetical protein